jgi:hypothetical protein
MISTLPRSIPADSATSAILSAGPISSGTIRPSLKASIAPDSAVASHGCATAVGTGGRLSHRARICSYLPVPVA